MELAPVGGATVVGGPAGRGGWPLLLFFVALAPTVVVSPIGRREGRLVLWRLIPAGGLMVDGRLLLETGRGGRAVPVSWRRRRTAPRVTPLVLRGRTRTIPRVSGGRRLAAQRTALRAHWRAASVSGRGPASGSPGHQQLAEVRLATLAIRGGAGRVPINRPGGAWGGRHRPPIRGSWPHGAAGATARAGGMAGSMRREGGGETWTGGTRNPSGGQIDGLPP